MSDKFDMSYYLKGNQWAIKYCNDMIFISHLWDDLIDKDKERTDQEINDAFRIAMVETQSNPFYKANEGILLPMMQSTILQYETANIVEKGIENKEPAFWLRNAVLNILGMCIFLVGGMNWYRQVSASFYQSLWWDYKKLYNTFKKEFQDG